MPHEQAIGLLLGVIADLQQQLLDKSQPTKDSSNSSKPPASDIVPRTRSPRRPSGKKPGGQAGHRGFTRQPTETPDLLQIQRPSCCSGCGTGFDPTLPGVVIERRQVIDPPPIRTITTEYQSLSLTCPHCQKATVGSFPPKVHASLSFGPRLQTTVTDPRDVHHLSYQRLQRALRDHFGCSISQAPLVGLIARTAQRCRPAYDAIKTAVIHGPVIGCDETGQKVIGRGHWLWTFRTSRLTYLVSSPSRGSDVLEGVLGGLTTAAAWVGDRWKAHFKVQAQGGHQLRAKQDGWSDPKWIGWRERAVLGLERRLDDALSAPTRSKVDRKPRKTLSKVVHRSALTLFLRRCDVPADNNGSERDFRPEKVHQKVIGGVCSLAGGQWDSIIMVVVRSASKQQRNSIDRLTKLIGKPQPIQVRYHLGPAGAE